jgi:glycerol-3-phosphate dehydrogenase
LDEYLDSLFIENTRVTDAGLIHLAGIPKLTFLRLAGTQVTDEAIAKLKRTLPKLKVRR